MSQKFPPGWYTTEDGQLGRWNGKSWTGEVQPPAPASRTVGWHVESDGIYRWWLGDHWSPARAAVDGRIDVLNRIGRALLDHCAVVGGPYADPVEMLRNELAEYPPCSIEAMTSHPSALIKGTHLATVISWAGPQPA